MAGDVGSYFTEVSGTSQKSQFKTEIVDFFYFGQEVAVCLLGQKAKGGAGGNRGFRQLLSTRLLGLFKKCLTMCMWGVCEGRCLRRRQIPLSWS